MFFRVLTYLSVFALTMPFAYGATPETESVPGAFQYVSGRLPKIIQVKTDLPNLGATVNADCSDIPLREFLANLAKQSNTIIYLDERKFANTQVAFSQPLTITIDEQISLKSALDLALEPFHLAYYIKDGRIVVTNGSFIVSAIEPMNGLGEW